MTPAIATLRQLVITLPAIEIPPELHVAWLLLTKQKHRSHKTPFSAVKPHF